MKSKRLRFLFLNLGHFLDHFFVLIFASVVAMRLTTEWGMSYAQLIPYATPGLVAFGLCAIPAGWLADKWSRSAMMVIFFIGIGLSSIYTGFANTPVEIGVGLTLVGIFAAIYHPVGIAMLVHGRQKTGIILAINGIFGNLGVACAALITGLLIDNIGWRGAFYLPGIFSVVIGFLYLIYERHVDEIETFEQENDSEPLAATVSKRSSLGLIFAIILFTTALGGLIFQSTTFALPKIFEERLASFAGSATSIGFYTFIVFTIAAFAQLIVGYLLDTRSVRTIFAWVVILQALLFGMMMHLTGLQALLVAIGFMLVVFGEIPINDFLVGRVAKNEWKSRAYALTYLVSFTVSAIAIPLIAFIHGKFGFDRLFLLLSICALLMFIAVLFLPKEISQNKLKINNAVAS